MTPDPPALPGDLAFTLKDATFLFVSAVVMLFTTGLAFGGGLGSLIVAQLAMAVPIVMLAVARGGNVAHRLGLNRPPGQMLLAAVLLGCSFWVWLAVLAALLQHLAYDGEREALTALLLGQQPFLFRLAAIAIVPAICEELLFRAVILPPLIARLGRGFGVALSAVLFGVFHLSLIRFLPTSLLGAVLGVVFVRSRSLFPCMVIHFLNNAVALVLVELEVDIEAESLPIVGLIALFATALGTWLVRTIPEPR